MTESGRLSALTDPQSLRALADPAARAALATEALTALAALIKEVSLVRDEALRTLRATGASYADLAALTGLTRGRVAQVLRRDGS